MYQIRNMVIFVCGFGLVFPANLFAQNASAQENWNYTTGAAVASSPAYSSGIIFVGSNDKNLYAINASTGLKVWNYTTGAPIESSPTVDGDLVFVGSEDKNLYAVSKTTGTAAWIFPTNGIIYSSPAVSQGVVFVGSDDNYLYAINISTGKKVWDFNAGGDIYSSPLVHQNSVFFGSYNISNLYNKLYALNAGTGAELWNFTANDGVNSSPSISNGVIFVGSNDKNLYAINASTGEQIWKYATNGVVFSSPCVSGNSVFVGSGDTYVYSIDILTGEKNWASPTEASVQSSPVVSQGVVFIGSNDGNLYAINAITGEKVWNFITGGDVFSSPAVAEGSVFVGSYDNKTYRVSTFEPPSPTTTETPTSAPTTTTLAPTAAPTPAPFAPPALGVSREVAKSGEVASSLGSTLSMVAATSPTQVGQASRTLLIFQILANEADAAGQQVQAWMQNPTQLSIGDGEYRYELGAVVGNWLIFAGVSGLWTLAAVRLGAPQAHYPGGLILPAMFLMTPTTTSGVTLVRDGDGAERSIGICSIAAQMAGVFAIAIILSPAHFEATWDSSTAHWDAVDGSSYLKRYGILFEKYRPGRQSFVLGELFMSMTTGVLHSFLAVKNDYSDILTGTAAASLAYVISLALLRPDHSSRERIFYTAIAAVEALALTTQAISVWADSEETQEKTKTVTESIAMVAEWALLAKSLWSLAERAISVYHYFRNPQGTPLLSPHNSGGTSPSSVSLDPTSTSMHLPEPTSASMHLDEFFKTQTNLNGD